MKRTKFVTTAIDVILVAILPALFLTFNGYDLGTATKKPDTFNIIIDIILALMWTAVILMNWHLDRKRSYREGFNDALEKCQALDEAIAKRNAPFKATVKTAKPRKPAAKKPAAPKKTKNS